MKDDSRKSRRGPVKIPDHERRTHTVSVRLNDAELNKLDSMRSKYQRGEFLRMSAIDKIPPQVPAVNSAAWVELSRSSANLNQIAKYINEVDPRGNEFMNRLRGELKEFRDRLIGVQFIELEDAE